MLRPVVNCACDDFFHRIARTAQLHRYGQPVFIRIKMSATFLSHARKIGMRSAYNSELNARFVLYL